jgi:hypothetical protein
MTEHYIENEAYNATIHAIAAMTHLGPDEIKIALREHGNVWPMSIRGDDPFLIRANYAPMARTSQQRT